VTELTPEERLVEEGRAYSADGDVDRAERAYRAAIEIAPDWSVPAYNLGLLCKYQRRWDESLALNRRAAELTPDDEAAWWNLGIAATALGRWAEARKAWERCGIRDPGGEDPPDYGFGTTAFRLDPDDEGEVVWGRRLDPARARLVSIPLPTSSFRWGDVVLADGAAEGHRVVNGVEHPVFNVLQRLVPSSSRTFIVELGSVSEPEVEQLMEIAEYHGGAAENWGATTRILCRACSFGVPHEHDRSGATPAHPHCGLAAASFEIARKILDRWLAACDGADLVTWYEHEGDDGRLC
jgi:hypothetical protein